MARHAPQRDGVEDGLISEVADVARYPIVRSAANSGVYQDVRPACREAELRRYPRRRHEVVDGKSRLKIRIAVFALRRDAGMVGSDLGVRRTTAFEAGDELLTGALRHGMWVTHDPRWKRNRHVTQSATC